MVPAGQAHECTHLPSDESQGVSLSRQVITGSRLLLGMVGIAGVI